MTSQLRDLLLFGGVAAVSYVLGYAFGYLRRDMLVRSARLRAEDWVKKYSRNNERNYR